MGVPTIIMVTSNGVGAGHLIRTSAIAEELQGKVRTIIFSMANSAIEVSDSLNMECEFIPGRDKGWMPRWRWDKYLRDRLIALIDETGARVVTFDGVVPYPGLFAMKFKRPQISLVWIRRGMWKTQPQGIALGIQSKLMDYVIEPGDIASDYDRGPTKDRPEAVVTNPVTLFKRNNLLSKNVSRRTLGIPQKKPAVLLQLGIGDEDMNSRVETILEILSKKNVEVVMTREPKLINGKSLSPANLNLHVIRFFPLAHVLNAFDGVICASGYNSVHEVLPAGIPTLFLPNMRGTDNQLARAKWCADSGLALISEAQDREDLESKVDMLLESKVQEKLRLNCLSVADLNGSQEIAGMLLALIDDRVNSLLMKRIRYQRLLAQTSVERGIGYIFRRYTNFLLRTAAFLLRTLFPHRKFEILNEHSRIEFHSEPRDAGISFKLGNRIEHVFKGSSDTYLEKRISIAKRAYQTTESEFNFHISRGKFGSKALNSSTKSA